MDDTAADRLHEEFEVTNTRNCYERIEARINLQVVGALIRDGANRLTIDKMPFQERADAADRALERALKELVGAETAKKLENPLFAHESVLIDIYFSLGMKAGARLGGLLMGGFDRDY